MCVRRTVYSIHMYIDNTHIDNTLDIYVSAYMHTHSKHHVDSFLHNNIHIMILHKMYSIKVL